MKVYAALALSLALSLAVVAPCLAARGPSTPEERQHAIDIVTLLETQPWTPAAQDGRKWLLDFLSAVPDITVKQCYSLLGSATERQGIPEDLLRQPMFSATGYLLQHPGAGAGSTETLLAGLSGALKSYRAWREQGSLPPVERYEQLLGLQASGQLEPYVRAQARHCI